VANLSDVPRHGYRVGLSIGGPWRMLLRTDHERFGGLATELPPLAVVPLPWEHRGHSTVLTLPPRTVLYLAPG
jgi:1,4-alpha-glucan branching enzyme